MEQEQEEWKDIEGYPNYSVSNFGFVMNNTTGRILKPRNNGKGYYQITLYDSERTTTNKLIHRLVAFAFCENPNNYYDVDHKDTNKLNNHYSNLRFVTKSQNLRNRKKRENCTSKYIGVSFSKEKNCWIPRIYFSGRLLYMGCFQTEEEAFTAFKKKVAELNLQDFYPLE